MNSANRPLTSDIVDVIASVETNFPVIDWKGLGVPIWPLLRVRLARTEWARHYVEPATSGGAKRSLSRAQKLLSASFEVWMSSKKDKQGSDRGPSRRDILFLSDGVSFAQIGGKWVERFCDPILSCGQELGLTSAMLTPGHVHLLPRHTPSRLVQPGLDRANALGAIWSRVKPVGLSLPEYDDVIRCLEEFGFKTESISEGQIRSDVLRLEALSHHYNTHLRRIRPRLAFIVGYYGIEGMAFVLACRRNAVSVVDIQHGVQGSFHPAYAAWPAPSNGRLHTLLPDFFWVWSDWERSVIEQWATKTSHRVIVGGNPWNSVWGDGSLWSGVSISLSSARALKSRANGRPVVLVTLQYGLAREEQLLPLFQLLREMSDRLAFWIRLHPSMLDRRAEVRDFLAPAGDFVLDEATDIPLPALLNQADVHLTHSSSTVIEAAQVGLKSVVTTRYGGELYTHLFASGMARLETGGTHAVAAALLELVATQPLTVAEAPRIKPSLAKIMSEISTGRRG